MNGQDRRRINTTPLADRGFSASPDAIGRALERRQADLPARPDRRLTWAPAYHTEAEACARLWVAVLIEHYELALSRGTMATDRERKAARAWWGSRGCRDVCNLIGVDPDALTEKVRADMADPTRNGNAMYGLRPHLNMNGRGEGGA